MVVKEQPNVVSHACVNIKVDEESGYIVPICQREFSSVRMEKIMSSRERSKQEASASTPNGIIAFRNGAGDLQLHAQ